MLGRCQNGEDQILRRILVLGNLRQVEDLLLADRDGVIDWLAMQVNESLSILSIINIIEHLPGNVPMNFLLRVFVLVLSHWIASLERVLVLPVQVVVHLCTQVLVLVRD